jgi:hypothetical protein
MPAELAREMPSTTYVRGVIVDGGLLTDRGDGALLIEG